MKKLIITAIAIVSFNAGLHCTANAYSSTAFDPATQQKSFSLSAEQFKNYEGEYQIAPSFVISVFQKDGKFYSQGTGQPEFEIFADAEHTFYATVADIKIRFTTGSDGKATHFILTQNGRSMPPAPRK
jgi:hypothetical protein